MGFQLWDRLSALARQAQVYGQERLFTSQTNLDRIISGGELLDFGKQHAILEQTNLQINRLERYKDFDQMDEVGEVSMGLDMYCLSGDTKIPLLDGTSPTIKELAESNRREYWLYSFDAETGEYVPGRAYGAHISGRNADLVEVEFDDGLKLRVTASHKFLTRDGYMKAADLKPGQSIVPLYKTNSLSESETRETRRCGSDQRKMAEKGYEFIRMTTGVWKPTHHWVYEAIFGERKGIIHHENLAKGNNDPANLKLKTWAEHQRIHMALGRNLPPEVMEAKRKKCSERVRAKWQDPEYRLKLRGHCQEMMQLMYHRGLAFRRKEEYSRVGWEELERYAQSGGSLRGIRIIARSLQCADRVINRILDRRNIDLETLRRSAVGNHKIVAVMPCGVAAEVYDLYVEKHRCFAAGDGKSWVIVHNSDEGTVTDSERKHTVMVRAKSKRVKEEIEDLLYNILNIDSFSRPAIRYLCKYGDAPFEIIPSKNRDAVASLKFMNVYNFTRVETKFGDLVGFFYQDEIMATPIFLHPWSVMHLRLTSFENIYHPYGCGILDPARKSFKQLRLMEDAALIYRITRAPERRIFKIPVGMIPAKEISGYMEIIARQFKKRRLFNPATGELDERWSPLIQEDDYWLPVRPDGSGPDVTTLPGGQNLDQIADIVYFKKKMMSAMKVPFVKAGLSESTGEESSRPASHISPEFAKSVQWVQREFLTGLKKACIVHLALRGHKLGDFKNFDLFMTASSAIDELYRIETWKSRADVIGSLKDTELFPDAWILRNFTDMTEEEVVQLQKEKAAAAPPPEEGDEGMPSLPEGYDAKAENKLITEWRQLESTPIPVEKERVFTNGFLKLLSEGQFDGLEAGNKKVEPKADGKLITEARDATKALIEMKKEFVKRRVVIQDEPTEEDLPPLR
jgi:hypothetical protein